jgi:hypothetical protein
VDPSADVGALAVELRERQAQYGKLYWDLQRSRKGKGKGKGGATTGGGTATGQSKGNGKGKGKEATAAKAPAPTPTTLPTGGGSDDDAHMGGSSSDEDESADGEAAAADSVVLETAQFADAKYLVFRVPKSNTDRDSYQKLADNYPEFRLTYDDIRRANDWDTQQRGACKEKKDYLTLLRQHSKTPWNRVHGCVLSGLTADEADARAQSFN